MTTEARETLQEKSNNSTKSPTISFRLEHEYIEGLDRIAQTLNTDRTEAMRKLIMEGCRKRKIPCRKVILPQSALEGHFQFYYIQNVIASLSRLPGVVVKVGELNSKKQYELKLSKPGEPNEPILVGITELHNINGMPSIYWYFPEQAGLPEQAGELCSGNLVFNVQFP